MSDSSLPIKYKNFEEVPDEFKYLINMYCMINANMAEPFAKLVMGELPERDYEKIRKAILN